MDVYHKSVGSFTQSSSITNCTNNYFKYHSHILQTLWILSRNNYISTFVSSNKSTNVTYATSSLEATFLAHNCFAFAVGTTATWTFREHTKWLEQRARRGFRKRERDSSGFGSRSAAVERGRADSRTILGRRGSPASLRAERGALGCLLVVSSTAFRSSRYLYSNRIKPGPIYVVTKIANRLNLS